MTTILRGAWKPRLVLAIVFLAGTMACLFLYKARARKEFVGRVVYGFGSDGDLDRRVGYRCRFTVSPAWSDVQESHDPESLWESRSFTLPSTPTGQWIDSHLLHTSSDELPTINLVYGPNSNYWVSLIDGYPELFLNLKPNKIVKHRHFKIDGHPAVEIKVKYSSQSETQLLIYVPEPPILFRIGGRVQDSQSASLDLEMTAIISSFQVEKVVSAANRL